MKPHDPLAIMQLITAAFAYTSNLPTALELIADCPGDTDTAASIASIIAGSYYGLEELSTMNCNEVSLLNDLENVSQFMVDMFNFNYTQAVQILTKLSTIVI